jgi:hypothetical protein
MEDLGYGVEKSGPELSFLVVPFLVFLGDGPGIEMGYGYFHLDDDHLLDRVS